MPRKSKREILQDSMPRIKFLWECYRRNENYLKEYQRLFSKVVKIDDILALLGPLENKYGDNATFQKLFAVPRIRNAMLFEAYQIALGPCVTEQDIEIINSLPPDEPFWGNELIVHFRRRWQIRYPKDPKEKFDPDKDFYLFRKSIPVRPLPSFYVIYASAALSALEELEESITHAKMPVVETLEISKKKWQARLEHKQEIGKKGEEVVALINTSLPKQEIMALLDYGISFSEAMVKKQTHRRWNDDWKMRFRAWDLRQRGLKNAEVATKIAEDFSLRNEPEDWKISEWCQYAGAMIAKVDSFALSEEELKLANKFFLERSTQLILE